MHTVPLIADQLKTLLEHLTAVLAIALVLTNGIVAFAKQIIELKFDAVKRKQAHDVLCMATSIVTGIVTTVGGAFVFFSPVTSQACALAGVFGYAVGLAAMGNYKMLTSLTATVESLIPALGTFQSAAQATPVNATSLAQTQQTAATDTQIPTSSSSAPVAPPA